VVSRGGSRQSPLLSIGSTLAALTLARLIALRLDDTHRRRHSGRVSVQPAARPDWLALLPRRKRTQTG